MQLESANTKEPEIFVHKWQQALKIMNRKGIEL